MVVQRKITHRVIITVTGKRNTHTPRHHQRLQTPYHVCSSTGPHKGSAWQRRQSAAVNKKKSHPVERRRSNRAQAAEGLQASRAPVSARSWCAEGEGRGAGATHKKKHKKTGEVRSNSYYMWSYVLYYCCRLSRRSNRGNYIGKLTKRPSNKFDYQHNVWYFVLAQQSIVGGLGHGTMSYFSAIRTEQDTWY